MELSDIFEPEVVVPKVTHEIPEGRKFSPPTSPKNIETDDIVEPNSTKPTQKPTQKATQKPTQKPPQVYPPGNSAQSSFLLVNFLVILIALF